MEVGTNNNTVCPGSDIRLTLKPFILLASLSDSYDPPIYINERVVCIKLSEDEYRCRKSFVCKITKNHHCASWDLRCSCWFPPIVVLVSSLMCPEDIVPEVCWFIQTQFG